LGKTAKAVDVSTDGATTPLKRGVNESRTKCNGGYSTYFSLLVLMLLIAGCRSPSTSPLRRFEFQSAHMGTLFTITLYASEKAPAESSAEAAFRRIAALEDIMSDYQADSELMRLCDQPFGKPVAVSAELFEVLQRAQQYSELSGGAFDVTVGPYVRLWRFARKRKVLPSPLELAEAAKAVGYKNLRLDPRTRMVTLLVPNMRLDLGGIAKGYAADQALGLLKSRGISRALVAASGDIAIGDPPPGQPGWKISITDLDTRPNVVSRNLLLHNAAVSTSGDTEQFIAIGGIRYSHILDPITGLGLTNRIQASIIAPNATATDALATTVCILGPERGLALIEALPKTSALVLVKKDGHTRSFPSRHFQIRPPQSRGTVGQSRRTERPKAFRAATSAVTDDRMGACGGGFARSLRLGV
jgi:thiamine biosynthesis lipoprotein